MLINLFYIKILYSLRILMMNDNLFKQKHLKYKIY